MREMFQLYTFEVAFLLYYFSPLANVSITSSLQQRQIDTNTKRSSPFFGGVCLQIQKLQYLQPQVATNHSITIEILVARRS
jgi:hypothetical protein